jgi:predicted dehydrogenase
MSTRRDFLKQTAAASVTAATTLHGTTKAADAKTKGKRNRTYLRFSIVGTGQVSLRYLQQTIGNERARFVSTCARTIESAKSRAVEFGIDAWFNDYEEMYDTVKPDAVVVATPPVMHAEVSIAALKRGIHVLCEKPMAMNYDECKAMIVAAQKNGAVFLGLPYEGGNPRILAAVEHLKEATLGVFTGADAQHLYPGLSRNNWVYDRTISGPAAGDTLIYPISRLVNLLGPARRVTGRINTLIPHRILGDGKTHDVAPPPRDPTNGKTVESTVDDNATLVIEWANGQQAIARTLWATSIFSYSTTIYGRRGTLWLPALASAANTVIVHSPDKPIVGATATTWYGYDDCYRIPVKELVNDTLVDHFIDCILGLARPLCGGEQALHVHEILFKGYEAAKSGRTQELETTFTPWHEIDPAFHDTRSDFI